MGGKAPNFSIQYKLFKKYRILNDRVIVESEKREARCAIKGSKRKKKSNEGVPSVIVVEAPKANMQEPLAEITKVIEVPVDVPLAKKSRDEIVPIFDHRVRVILK